MVRHLRAVALGVGTLAALGNFHGVVAQPPRPATPIKMIPKDERLEAARISMVAASSVRVAVGF